MAKITIFGLPGTGTSTVGRMLAERINYPFVSTGGLFRELAAQAGMSLEAYDKLAETDISIDKTLDAKVAEIGKTNENLVLESRLGWYFVPDSLKVKLSCDDTERLTRVARRDRIAFEEAKRISDLRDTSHRERFSAMYGIENLGGDEYFDLIIDTTKTRAHEVVELICQKINL